MKQPLSTARRVVAVGAALALCLGAVQAVSAASVSVPSDVNFRRFQLLDKPDGEHKDGLTKVYVVVKGESVNGNLLVTSAKHLQRVTLANLRQLLLNKIRETNRFDVYDAGTTGVHDQSSIVVEGKIVGATQHLENMVVARKAITRVRLSVTITETDTGKVLKAKTFNGHYGDNAKEGTVIVSDAELAGPHIQESLYKDYDRALGDALDDVAAYVESKYRPVGKVHELAGDTFAIDGGSLHGFRGDDEIVVFRTKFSNLNGQRVPGIMKGLARAKCVTVSERSSTCEITKKADGAELQVGDYALVSDETLSN